MQYALTTILGAGRLLTVLQLPTKAIVSICCFRLPKRIRVDVMFFNPKSAKTLLRIVTFVLFHRFDSEILLTSRSERRGFLLGCGA